MPRTFDELYDKAAALLADGFRTKAARADSMYHARNAFDLVMREVRDALLADETDRKGDAWNLMCYTPDFANWTPRRAGIYAARFPAAVERANRLSALREEIKAAPLLAKAPTKKSIELAARLAVAKTCQICGRPIFAEVGVIAHHGYQRPGQGWQTASCRGARELPFEVSRDILGSYIANLEKQQVAAKAFRSNAAAEAIAIRCSYEVDRLAENGKPLYARGERLRSTVYFNLTRATAAEEKALHPKFFARLSDASFDGIKARDLAERDRDIKYRAAYIKFQQARYDGWRKA